MSACADTNTLCVGSDTDIEILFLYRCFYLCRPGFLQRLENLENKKCYRKFTESGKDMSKTHKKIIYGLENRFPS